MYKNKNILKNGIYTIFYAERRENDNVVKL